MSTAVAKRPSYDSLQISLALTELAACHGNTHEAARRLKDTDAPVSQRTLWAWKNKDKADEYQRIREEIMPAVREAAAEASLDLADRYAEFERENLKYMMEDLAGIPTRDRPGASRNIATSRAIHIDKASQLRGEATGAAGTDKRTVRELLRGLQAKGADVDVVDAEVVEEQTLEP